jgi:hypothetical protein
MLFHIITAPALLYLAVAVFDLKTQDLKAPVEYLLEVYKLLT